MTPIRIHLHTRLGTALGVLASLAIAVVGLAVLCAVSPAAWEMIRAGEGSLFSGKNILCVLSLLAIAGGVAGAGSLYNSQHLWVDLGRDLSRHTLAGVFRHEWSDIDTVQLVHRVNEQVDDEGDSSYQLVTAWVMKLTNGEKLDLEPRVASLDAFHAGMKDVYRTMVAGLHDPTSDTRWHAAEALGRIGSPVVPDLNREMRRMCKAQRAEFSRDGAKALRLAAACRMLQGRAVPHLIGATQDGDPRVRRAAAQSLQRICPASYHRWERNRADNSFKRDVQLEAEFPGSSECRALCETT